MHLLPGLSLPEVVLVLSLRLATFGFCLVLAQFIDCAVSAVSWTPDSFHFAWMSTVVAWGLVSSSWDSCLWIEWSWLVYLGLSNSSLDYLGSEPYSCCCFGSVLCLRCSCGVLDPWQFLSSLDECHSYMLAWPHHPALVTFGWYCHFLCFFPQLVFAWRTGGGLLAFEYRFSIFLLAVLTVHIRWSSFFGTIYCCWWPHRLAFTSPGLAPGEEGVLSWCLILSDSLYSFPPVVLRLPYTLGGLL